MKKNLILALALLAAPMGYAASGDVIFSQIGFTGTGDYAISCTGDFTLTAALNVDSFLNYINNGWPTTPSANDQFNGITYFSVSDSTAENNDKNLGIGLGTGRVTGSTGYSGIITTSADGLATSGSYYRPNGPGGNTSGNVDNLATKLATLNTASTLTAAALTYVHDADARSRVYLTVQQENGTYTTYSGANATFRFANVTYNELTVDGNNVLSILMKEGDLVTSNDVAQGLNVAALDAVKSIPEPTTATLSLLALAGLAARRRRK